MAEFQFCPKCGGGLQVRNGRLVCEKCGFILYRNPTVGVAVILLHGDRVSSSAADPVVGTREPGAFPAATSNGVRTCERLHGVNSWKRQGFRWKLGLSTLCTPTFTTWRPSLSAYGSRATWSVAGCKQGMI